VDYCASPLSVKEYGRRFKLNLQMYDDKKLYVTIGYKDDFKKFGKYFVKRFLDEPKYLPGLVKWSEKNKYILKEYLEENFKHINSLSNEEFWKRFKGYIDKYRYFHLKNTPAWWLGSDLAADELKRSLERFENADEIFEIITDPLEYQTENLREELSLLKIAIIAKQQGITRLTNNESPRIAQLLEDHTDNFSYIPFGYNTGVIWNKKYFIRKINQLLKRDPQFVRKSILGNITEKIKNRDELIRQSKLSKKEKILAESLRALAYLQEIKKAAQTKSHPFLNLVIYKDLSRRLGIAAKSFGYISYPEIRDCLLKGVSRALVKELCKRKSFSAVVLKDCRFDWIYGQKVKDILRANDIGQEVKNIKLLKGIPASRGFFKGRVLVCFVSTEISRVKKGDVLVTGMTTPDFVPAMKKAGAIITDEGGITSHAAIVARELNKPCIIGTKIATQVLKDGDLVEVDANKGIVKIINK
jgi:phosphohistidine swiveling domain-containing protein